MNMPGTSALVRSPRELVVLARPAANLATALAGVASFGGTDLDDIMARHRAWIEPLFGLTELRLDTRLQAVPAIDHESAARIPRYYCVEAPDDRLEALAEELARLPTVEAAYVKPAGQAPFVRSGALDSVDRSAAATPPTTPDFRGRQGYLGPAPVGVDAFHAWARPGGRGAGVRILDCEWGWNFSHEDLLENQSGVVVGSASGDGHHGTAVVGIISADDGPSGVVGIAPEAPVSAAAFGRKSARTIRKAADRLSAGDILLLEIHRPGPNNHDEDSQFGFIATEWWPDDFDAIRYAVGRGIVVVEAAGNGHQDLDSPIYETGDDFPSSWRNPFNPANRSSGAVLVAAGNPPSGTHGRTFEADGNETYVDRARCGFSNYGSRVDCQGWGWEVTSTGYGDLQGGISRDIYYTDVFAGTSSASPIVVGALACVQGILRAAGRPLLDSGAAIALLRATGSPQADAPGRPSTQRIGQRPDIRAMLVALGL